MTKTIAIARANSDVTTILAAAILVLGLVFAAGMSHSATLHEVAHDARHATGFPCH